MSINRSCGHNLECLISNLGGGLVSSHLLSKAAAQLVISLSEVLHVYIFT